jgi:hypothetical protein
MSTAGAGVVFQRMTSPLDRNAGKGRKDIQEWLHPAIANDINSRKKEAAFSRLRKYPP